MSAEINFISLKPRSDETRVMYTRSDNEEFMSSDDTNEIIKLLFESFLQRFEENVQNKMRYRNLNLMELTFSIIALIKRAYIELVLI